MKIINRNATIYILFFLFNFSVIFYSIYLIFFTQPDYIENIRTAIWALSYPCFLFIIIIYKPINLILRNSRSPKLYIFISISGLIQFILLFSYIYKGTGILSVISNKIIHNGFESIYYSVITITTVGYGDYIPANDAGRFAAMTESILGYFFLSIFIATFIDVMKRSNRFDSVDTKYFEANTKMFEANTKLVEVILLLMKKDNTGRITPEHDDNNHT